MANAIGVRIVVWGSVTLAALVIFGGIGHLFPRTFTSGRPAGERVTVEFTPPADPGWPHRRGPNYDAVSDETDLADSWPPEGPPVLWTKELGRGYSGFTAVEDRVYTQTQTLLSQSVLCLDADTGEEIWRHNYALPYESAGMYPGPYATPTWYEGRIYFAGPRGLVGCLRASDGAPLWSVDLKEKFQGRGWEFGYACSPTVEDGRVIMPAGGKGASVVALDAYDGSTVWQSGNAPSSYCSAIPITFRGRRLLVVFLQNTLALFDPKTGEPLWEEKCSQGYDEHAAAPLYREPYLLIACPFQSGAECYRLDAAGPEGPAAPPTRVNVTSVTFTEKFSNDTASGVMLGRFIYGFDLRDAQSRRNRPSRGKFKCFELTDDEKLVERWAAAEPGHATVIAADGKLILFNDRGEVILARANPQQYEELARTEVFGNEICWTAPALHRGRLYLRTPKRAACLFLGKPEKLTAGQRARARPAAEILKVRSFDLLTLVGGERKYAFDAPRVGELGLWYAFSLLGALVVPAVIAAAVHWLVGRVRPGTSHRSSRVVFWTTALLLAVLATPVLNRLLEEFIFTWPASLFVAHQIALILIVRSGREATGRHRRWISLLATLLLLGTCAAYFLACRKLAMPIEWIFLLGFLPSWPIAVPAAYRLQRDRHPIWDFLWAGLSFSAYFWSSAALMLWKASMM